MQGQEGAKKKTWTLNLQPGGRFPADSSRPLHLNPEVEKPDEAKNYEAKRKPLESTQAGGLG